MKCRICSKDVSDINEYLVGAEIEGITPEEFVKCFEGTYKEQTETFICTTCFY